MNISTHTKLLQAISGYDSKNLKTVKEFEQASTEYFFSGDNKDIYKRAGLHVKGEKNIDTTALQDLVEAVEKLSNKVDSNNVRDTIEKSVARVRNTADLDEYELTKEAQAIFNRIAQIGEKPLNLDKSKSTASSVPVSKQSKLIPDDTKDLISLIDDFLGQKGNFKVTSDIIKEAAEEYFFDSLDEHLEAAMEKAGVYLSLPGTRKASFEKGAAYQAVFEYILAEIDSNKEDLQKAAILAIADALVSSFERIGVKFTRVSLEYGRIGIEPKTLELFQKANAFKEDVKYQRFLDAPPVTDEIRQQKAKNEPEATKVELKNSTDPTTGKVLIVLLILLVLALLVLIPMGLNEAYDLWQFTNDTLAPSYGSNVSSILSNITNATANITNIANITGNASIL